MPLNKKKILLSITGSIAAYKTPMLVRLLVKQGAEVQVIQTENAKQFVTPVTLATVSGKPVLSQFSEKETGTWNSHVELGLWADAIIIAPTSANTLAKLAIGMADNLVTATYLAAKCPVFIAPAMDLDMYKHPTTQNNIATLKSNNCRIITGGAGELASGLCGEGRMEEPEEIVRQLKNFFEFGKPLKNKKIMVTAGPTYEKIDAVRFVGNYSSGKMGFAIAETLAKLGAKVTLITGPTNLNTTHQDINRIDIESAEEMLVAVKNIYPNTDAAIMAAAVADYKPQKQYNYKLKKANQDLSVSFEPTTDILKWMGKNKNEKQILVGFALETDNELINAKEKLQKKNLDYIVLNSLKDKQAGFGFDTNKVTVLNNKNEQKEFSLQLKSEIAKHIISYVFNLKQN